MRVASLLVIACLLVSTANAGDREELPGEDELYSCLKAKGTIKITFKPETKIEDLVTWVMSFTCKNFVYNPNHVSTGRKVSIVAPSVMSAAEAYRLFLAALATTGLTAVPQGNVMKIVEAATAKRLAIPFIKSGSVEASDQLVRYVMRPTYVPAETLGKALANVKSDAGEVVPVGSIVMIADTGRHVADMLAVAKLVDVPVGSDGVYTLPVVNADATKLATHLTGLLAGPDAPTKLSVDDRTNTIVLMGTPAAYERARALVHRLDVSLGTEDGSSIHVFPLQSAIAEEVVATLTASMTKSTQGATAARPRAPADPRAPAGPEVRVAGETTIVADKATNKLIITATARDYLALKEVILELDQPRRQVYIEALILELTVGDDLAYGGSLHGGKVGSSTTVLGGTQLGTQSTITDESFAATLGSARGLVAGMLGASTELLGVSVPSFGVLVEALATRSNTNIISAPSIIAVDNEEAKYKVGTNIPYQKGFLPQTAGSTVITSTAIERADLELELTIKPHISTGDTVLLEITHASKELAETNTTLGPSWSTRSIQTRAVVPDQQTVVIGGLIQEKEVRGASQVPLLGDIPVLGALFRYTKREKKKTNLVVMLTPYIIKDALDLERIRAQRVREREELTRSLSTLENMVYQPRIDYRRKRGLVEEINRSVLRVEEDRATRASLAIPTRVEAGPVQASP